jgi:hypothetical protein
MLPKLTALCLLIMLSFVADAQFKKGMRMVGVNIASGGFNSGNSDVSFPSTITGYSSKVNSYSFNLNPSIGWFISDKTAVGISLNINPTGRKETYESNANTFQQDKTNSFNLGIGGFARNYFSQSGSSFRPFGQLGLNLGMSSQTTSGFFIASGNMYKSTYSGKSSGGFFANAALSLGLTKMINPHTGLDIYLGYSYSYSKATFKTTTLKDIGNNGSVDETSKNEPTTKFTSNGVLLGVGLQIFLD